MMKEIIEKCAALNVYEKREASDGYFELAFFSKDEGEWGKVLAGILDPAIKLPGARPSKEDLLLTEKYGGIFTNQTLFRRKFDGNIIIAMFWPWQDGIHTTLKVAVVRE
jgi:hypothetical protein